jgi:hypothetical protein
VRASTHPALALFSNEVQVQHRRAAVIFVLPAGAHGVKSKLLFQFIYAYNMRFLDFILKSWYSLPISSRR